MVHTPPEVELLAPAGNWECARAAVENGADAIYFGLDVGFNARARAANFHVDELDDLIEADRLRGGAHFAQQQNRATEDREVRLVPLRVLVVHDIDTLHAAC